MQSTTAKVKKPVDAFPKCPCCLTDHHLSITGIHVFCGFCGWDSVQAYADAGGYESVDRESVSLSFSNGLTAVTGLSALSCG